MIFVIHPEFANVRLDSQVAIDINKVFQQGLISVTLRPRMIRLIVLLFALGGAFALVERVTATVDSLVLLANKHSAKMTATVRASAYP